MQKPSPYENRYCNHCQMTTRHEVRALERACLQCGSVKYPSAHAIAIHRARLVGQDRREIVA